MATLERFENLEAFVQANQDKFDENHIGLYNLIACFEKITRGEFDFIKAFNITEGKAWIICLLFTGNIFIYDENSTDKMITLLDETLPPSDFIKNLAFTGTRGLVLGILDRSKKKYILYKDRVYYECTKVNEIASNKGQAYESRLQDLVELSDMAYNYHQDEYNGQGWHTHSEIEIRTKNGLVGKTFVEWRDENGQVCSILQMSNRHSPTPFIGHFFTNRDLRNKGYGTSLLHSVTQKALNGGKKSVGLNGDVANSASEKAFLKVGFVPVYKTAYCFINE